MGTFWKGVRYVFGFIVSVAVAVYGAKRLLRFCAICTGVYFAWRWAILSIVFGIVGLYTLTASVSAQTATPTPTPFPTSVWYGQHSALFPGGYNQDAFYICYQYGETEHAMPQSSTVFWLDLGCAQLNTFMHPDGFGGYFWRSEEINRFTIATTGSYQRTEWDVVIIPPTSMQTITVQCDVVNDRYDIFGGPVSASTQPSFRSAKASTFVSYGPTGAIVHGNGATSILVQYWLASPASRKWDYYADALADAVATPGSAQKSVSGPARLEWLAVSSGINDETIASAVCYVTSYSLLPGGPTPNAPIFATPTPAVGTPTMTPTPAATGDWAITPWVPVTSTVNAPFFEVSPPISATCYLVVPGIEIDSSATGSGGTWWDWVIGAIPLPDVSTTPVEFCIQEWGLSLRVFGYDMGAALVTMLGLGAAGVLFSILKSP